MDASAAAGAATPRVPSWLVGLDGSPESHAALRGALEIARLAGLRLTALSVSEDLATRPSMYMLSTGTARTLQRELDAHARGLLDQAAGDAPDGVRVARLFRRGVPADTILAEVEQGRHDAVILGARGAGESRERFGSVTQRVLERAQVPVVVVPTGLEFADGALPQVAHAGAGGP